MIPLLLAGCIAGSPSPGSAVYSASHLAPEVDTRGLYKDAPLFSDDTGAWPTQQSPEILYVTFRAEQWEVRCGLTFESSDEVATWSYVVSDDGMFVDGIQVLPGTIREGDVFDDGTVTEIRSDQERVSVKIDSGAFAGRWIFLPGSGPVWLALDGRRWGMGKQEEL